jgi:hypothetical protein
MKLQLAVSCLVLGALGFYGCGSDDKSVMPRDGGAPGAGGVGDGGQGSQAAGGSLSVAGKAGATAGGAGGGGEAETAGGAGSSGEAATAGGASGGSNADRGGAPGEGGSADGGSAASVGVGGAGGAATCNLGEVTSAGTQQNLNLFGDIVYFADGATLPAGRYRATYVDGCMKYASSQDWTIHAYPDASYGWWFVGNDTSDKIVAPPGTSGYSVATGAFSEFEACVAANQALPPLEFDFGGGKIGVWLQDSPYSDNLAGQDGRNPKWQLTLLGECQ